jgi:Coenzyme PQQ synthesis protein D (PqqD)
MADYFPCKRCDALLVEEVIDELLIYDQRSDQAHCLNRTAAAIWRACDGSASIGSVAATVTEALGNPCDEQLVCYTLEQLHERNLLEIDSAPPPEIASRREVIRRLGMGAILITTILAPTAAMAQSCGPQGPQGPQGCP